MSTAKKDVITLSIVIPLYTEALVLPQLFIALNDNK